MKQHLLHFEQQLIEAWQWLLAILLFISMAVAFLSSYQLPALYFSV